MKTVVEKEYKRFWDEERETLDPSRRETMILERIQSQLQYAYHNLPFYRKLYDQHGVKPEDVRSMEDFTTKIPVITKKMLVEDQRNNPIFGSYAGDHREDEIARVQGSSGTSGTPTFYRVSKTDWDRAADMHAMALWTAGFRPNDVVQITFPFSLFFGGWGALQGLERLGATSFPLGAIESDRQLTLMNLIRPTAFVGTPSYALHLLSRAKEMGVELSENSVKRFLVGGEAGGGLREPKRILSEGWGASIYDAATTSEMYPFFTHVECEDHGGVHCYIDEVLTEIVSHDNANESVPLGSKGALVYTHLWRTSQPMIRFWSGDESYMTNERCSCGRTYPRLPEGVLGRIDDMLIIRGANIYPSAIENTIRSLEWAGTEYMIHVEKKGELDEMTIQLEYTPEYIQTSERPLEETLEMFRRHAEHRLKMNLGIRIGVEILKPASLPKTVFKARRVVDKRKNK